MVLQGLTGFGGGATGLSQHSAAGGASEYATGGTKDTSSKPGYVLHVFTSPGNFVIADAPPTKKSIDVLLVGGGGGASGHGVAGGGAGGLIWRPATAVIGTTYPITIGEGGVGADNDGESGSAGQNSTAFSLTALGGGGASHSSGGESPQPWGGSGAGGGYGGEPGGEGKQTTDPTLPADSKTYGFGNDGGAGGGSYAGGGGGGAGGVGQSLPNPTYNSNGGTGGTGKDMSPYVGTAYGSPSVASNNYTTGGGWFAGGGAGNSPNTAPNVAHPPTGETLPAIVGGAGGGGNGMSPWGSSHPQSFCDGKDGSGGGGGAGNASGTTPAGNGGDGVCIIRYPDAY